MRSVFDLMYAALAAAGICLAAGCGPQPANTSSEDIAVDSMVTAGFDSLLAARLGADEYGMSRYVMAFLKAGPDRSQDSATAAEIQRAHLANISRMAEEGTLVLAGPFLDDGTVRGIYIFDVETLEEARALTETDPAVQAGRLEMELHPWYGSAGLKQLNEIHGAISRENP